MTERTAPNVEVFDLANQEWAAGRGHQQIIEYLKSHLKETDHIGG